MLFKITATLLLTFFSFSAQARLYPVCRVNQYSSSSGKKEATKEPLSQFQIGLGSTDAEVRLKLADGKSEALKVRCTNIIRLDWDGAYEYSCLVIQPEVKSGFKGIGAFSGQNNVGGYFRVTPELMLQFDCSPFYVFE